MDNILELNEENTPKYIVKLNGQEHAVDPITLVLQLQGVGDNLPQIIAFVRDAFLAPALSDAQALVVLAHFREYVENLQKKMLPPPNSSPPTAPPHSNVPDKSGWRSGSISPASAPSGS